jgi:hypothetical protein
MTRTAMRQLIVLALVAAFARDAHAGACMMPGFAPEVLTHSGDPLPVDGGVLVGLTTGNTYARDGTDPSQQASWRFRVGKREVKPVMTALAPGLAVYAVPKRKKGKVTLLDQDRKKRGTYTAGAKQKLALAAPVIASMAVSQWNEYRGGTGMSVTVTLDAAPPADAYGLIAYTGDQALTYAVVTGVTTPDVMLYRSPGRCGMQAPGTQVPSPGTTITLAWVDHVGRVSARSATFTVPAATPPPSNPSIGP